MRQNRTDLKKPIPKARSGAPSVLGLFPASRALSIAGEINDDLVAPLIPRILELRAVSKEPIGVVIHSDGGSMLSIEHLRSAFGMDELFEPRPKVHTVAVANAGSAAAVLLTLGDLAAVRPSARIHFHGVRQYEPELTEQRAIEHGVALNSYNTEVAVMLARRMLPRMLDTLGRHPSENAEQRKFAAQLLEMLPAPLPPGAEAIARLAATIANEVSEHAGEHLRGGWSDLRRLHAIRSESPTPKHRPSPGVMAALKSREQSERELTEHNVRVFNTLMAWRLRADSEVMLDFEDMAGLARDAEFYARSTSPIIQEELLASAVENDDAFFEPAEWKFAYALARKKERTSKREDARLDELMERVHRRAEGIWAFTLGISRSLLEGETELTPEDAWWLGLLDVVIGTPLDRRSRKRRRR